MAVFACALPAPLPQVLIDRGGDIKLTDFGVSTHVPESTLQVGRRLRVYVVGGVTRGSRPGGDALVMCRSLAHERCVLP